MATAKPYTLTKEDRRAWRDMLGTPNKEKTSVAVIFAAVQLLAIPFSVNEAFSLLYFLLTFGFYYLITHSLMLTAATAVPALLVLAVVGNSGAVAFLAMLFGSALCGYVILHFSCKPVHLTLLLIPIATWGITFLATGDLLRGLLTWLPLPAAIVFALLFSRCTRCTDTILTGAAVNTLVALAAGIVTLAAMGKLEGNVLALFAQDMRELLVEALTDARAVYEEAGVTLALTDHELFNTAAMTVNLFPAIFFITVATVSYLSYRIFLRTVVTLDEMHKMPRSVIGFSVSPTAAILFLSAFLLSLFVGNDHSSFFGVLLQNLYLILEPCLVLVGFTSLVGGGKEPRSCLSGFILLGLGFMLFTNPVACLTLTAFYGAITILVVRFIPFSEEKGG